MKNYYRIMPGPKSIYVDECLKGNFIGTDFGLSLDLSSELPENWRDFNSKLYGICYGELTEDNQIETSIIGNK